MATDAEATPTSPPPSRTTWWRHLLAPVHGSEASASYKDGILEVRIPVPPESAPSEAKRIPISRS